MRVLSAADFTLAGCYPIPAGPAHVLLQVLAREALQHGHALGRQAQRLDDRAYCGRVGHRRGRRARRQLEQAPDDGAHLRAGEGEGDMEAHGTPQVVLPHGTGHSTADTAVQHAEAPLPHTGSRTGPRTPRPVLL